MEKTVERIEYRNVKPRPEVSRYERLAEAAEYHSFLLHVFLREMKRLRVIENRT